VLVNNLVIDYGWGIVPCRCAWGMTNMYLSLHAEADPVFSEGGLESGMDLEERG